MTLLDLAVPGSKVRASMYAFGLERLAEAFVRASKRGVDVRLVLDYKSVGSATAAVRVLRAGLPGEALHVCPPGDGCIGTAYNHHKYFLFSRLSDGSRHVVAHSSWNATDVQLKMHNYLVVARSAPRLFEAFLGQWRLQRAGFHEDRCFYRERVISKRLRVHFFPNGGHPSCGGDPIVEILEEALPKGACRSGASVRVAMSLFSRESVATALADVARRGCAVSVLGRDPGDHGSLGMTTGVQAILRGAGVDVHLSSTRYHLDGGVHHKYMLIDRGTILKKRRHWLVTGSHNYNDTSLTGAEESLLEYRNHPTLYRAFAEDWAAIHAKYVLAEDGDPVLHAAAFLPLDGAPFASGVRSPPALPVETVTVGDVDDHGDHGDHGPIDTDEAIDLPPAPTAPAVPDSGTDFAGAYCAYPGGSCGGNEPCWPAEHCPVGSRCDWAEGSWGRCLRE